MSLYSPLLLCLKRGNTGRKHAYYASHVWNFYFPSLWHDNFFPKEKGTKNRIPPKTIYFVIRAHIGEHHPFLSLPCDYAVLPLTMPYDYAQLPLTQHVTVGLNPIWPSTMPNFGMGRPRNNNEASKCIRIFSRFFPYITLVNFWFQASGHSFSPRIVIFGLSEPCTIENWRLLKFFENSIFYG